MAWAFLGIVATSVALPASAGEDAEVAWDLIDLPFSIDDSLLSEQLKHDDADTAPIRKDVALLHRTSRSNLTHANLRAVERSRPKPLLRADELLKEPRRVTIRHKPFVWLHVHKAGGTLMCEMAKRMEEKVVIPENNCNWIGHDRWRDSGQPSLRKSCAERAKMYHESGFTYGQIEREVDDDELCEKFRYGVMFREPLALMASIMNYELWYQTMMEHNAYPDPFLHFPANLTAWLQDKIEAEAVPVNELAPSAWLDNFQTRFLANAFDVPAGQITKEHLTRAQAFLQKHNVTVHVLEDLPMTGEKLFKELGWRWNKAALKRKKMSIHTILTNNPSHKTEQRPFTPEETEYLRRVNKYDLELYNGARVPAAS
jgi:hypothetical protein